MDFTTGKNLVKAKMDNFLPVGNIPMNGYKAVPCMDGALMLKGSMIVEAPEKTSMLFYTGRENRQRYEQTEKIYSILENFISSNNSMDSTPQKTLSPRASVHFTIP